MEKTEVMYSLVEEYNNSGVSVKKFAASKGIKLSTFGYWIRKKRSSERKGSHGNFIAIENKSLTASARLQIFYPNGVRIMSNSFDLVQIEQLIKLY